MAALLHERTAAAAGRQSTAKLLAFTAGLLSARALWKRRAGIAGAVKAWWRRTGGPAAQGGKKAAAKGDGGRSAFSFPKGRNETPAPAAQRAGGMRVNAKKSQNRKAARRAQNEAKRADEERRAKEALTEKEERELNKKLNNMADWEKTFTTRSEYKMDARLAGPKR